ncbi:hypothetical protein ACF05L_34125 [Streptomyces bobili]|uniref:hypothetical protein n=1 Tax=Streptomyces bobili TaxID=67280 RepID=UPI0036F7FCE0
MTGAAPVRRAAPVSAAVGASGARAGTRTGMSAYPYHGTCQGALTVWAFAVVPILLALVVGGYIWRRP